MGAGDVSIDTVGCRVDVADGTITVTAGYVGSWDQFVAAKRSNTFVGGHEPTTVGEHSAYDTGTALVVDDGAHPLRVTTQDLDVSDEVAAELRVSLAELALGT
jgi:hypothetical protein